MAEDPAIALDDGINVEKRVVKRAPEVKLRPMKGFKFFRHQVAHRPDRGPDPLPTMDTQVMGVSLNAISTHQSQPDQREDGCNNKIMYKSESENQAKYLAAARCRTRPP